MPFYDSVKVEIKLDGVSWTDVSADVVPPIEFTRGITDNAPMDRVAGIGQMTFALKNSMMNSARLMGYYSPAHDNCRTGFGTGKYVRLVASFEGVDQTRFFGKIPDDGIDVDAGTNSSQLTHVTVYDWMEQAYMHELDLPAYTTNKRMDQVMVLIEANMPITPLSNSYATGYYTFPAVFDTVRNKTTAASEYQKLCNSELSYVYLRCAHDSDEVLVSEQQFTRNDIAVLSSVIKPKADCGDLLLESDDYFLLESGDKLILDETLPIGFDNNMKAMETTTGKHMANNIRIVAYPKKVDASNVVLFTQQSEIQIEAGATTPLMKATYRDPTGGAPRVSAQSMVTPVATTDFTMFTATAGGGSNITANLVIAITFGAEGAEFTLTNNNAAKGYVNFLQFRGKGVYIYDPVELVVEDTTSRNLHGPHIFRFDAKYQSDPTVASSFASILINHYKDPGTTGDYLVFDANEDYERLGVFFRVEPGDMIQTSEEVTGITNKDYFVQGLSATITGNSTQAFVEYTLYVKPANYDRYEFALFDVDYFDGAKGFSYS